MDTLLNFKNRLFLLGVIVGTAGTCAAVNNGWLVTSFLLALITGAIGGQVED